MILSCPLLYDASINEINRAPAKVQSALLEAMQERQVTIGKETFLLPWHLHIPGDLCRHTILSLSHQ